MPFEYQRSLIDFFLIKPSYTMIISSQFVTMSDDEGYDPGIDMDDEAPGEAAAAAGQVRRAPIVYKRRRITKETTDGDNDGMSLDIKAIHCFLLSIPLLSTFLVHPPSYPLSFYLSCVFCRLISIDKNK